MHDSATTTFWLALHGALVLSLLARDGVGWRLMGVFAGFESLFVVELAGYAFSPVLAGTNRLGEHVALPFMLIVIGLLPFVMNTAFVMHTHISPLRWRSLRQRDTLGISVMTLGMLLLSGSIVLFVLWHVIAAENVRLARES